MSHDPWFRRPVDDRLKCHDENHKTSTRSSLEPLSHLGTSNQSSSGPSIPLTNPPLPHAQTTPLIHPPSTYVLAYMSHDLLQKMSPLADLNFQSQYSVPIPVYLECRSRPSATTGPVEVNHTRLPPIHPPSTIALDHNTYPPIPHQPQHYTVDIDDGEFSTRFSTGKKMDWKRLSNADIHEDNTLADRFTPYYPVTQMHGRTPHGAQSSLFRKPPLGQRLSREHISAIPELDFNQGLSPKVKPQHRLSKKSRDNLSLPDVATDANLDPDSYVYENLGYSKNAIRLLRLHPRRLGVHVDDFDEINCDIIHTYFKYHPVYNALSYTWGDSSDNEHTIRINGKTFKVKENLHQALHRLRSGFHNTYIWIDAICINQEEGIERNHQVGIMRTIYERAEKVLVWLGDACENSQNALTLADHLYNYRQSEEDLAKHVFATPDIALYFKALKELFARGYWGRIWVVQEITVAKDVLVICGTHTVSLKILIEAQKVMSSEQGQRALALQPLEDNIWSQIIWNGPSSIHASRAGFLERRLSLYEAVQYHYLKGASDPRDKLFALMGLSNDAYRHALEIDYSTPVEKVYYEFAKCEIVNSGRLDIITKVQYNPRGRWNLPSWVPDWTFNKKDHVRLQNIRRPDFHYRAGGNTRARVDFIPDTGEMRMMGVQVGTISYLGVQTHMCNPEDWKAATTAIREWGWPLTILSGKRDEKLMSPFTLEQFARTLLCDHVTAESVGAGFLKTLVGAIFYLIFSLFPGTPLQFQSVWMEYCHDEIMSKPEEQRMTYALNVALNAQEYIWDRRFFLTDQDQMGMAPEEAEAGDAVVIPLGCSGPVVVRLINGYFRIIGECYVDGVMYGEAMENIERPGFKIGSFLVR